MSLNEPITVSGVKNANEYNYLNNTKKFYQKEQK